MDLTTVFVECAKQAPAYVVLVVCMSLIVWKFLKHIREGETERSKSEQQRMEIQTACIEAVQKTTSDCREFQKETLHNMQMQFDRIGNVLDRNSRIVAKNTSMIEAIYNNRKTLDNGTEDEGD